MTGKAIADTDSDAVELSASGAALRAASVTSAKSGSLARGGTATATLNIPADIEPGSADDPHLARALAGRLAAGRARLPDGLSVRLHRADAVVVPAERDRRTHAGAAEAAADRAAVAASTATRRPGVQRLLDYQHDDGGWGWWKTDENHPFMTAYAIYGLLETQAAGYKVPEDRMRSGLTALAQLYRKYPRAVAGAEGLHGLRARARRRRASWSPATWTTGPFDLNGRARRRVGVAPRR